MEGKRQFGVYDTERFNPFAFEFFRDWVRRNNLGKERVLEPFAGSNKIVDLLRSVELATSFSSYDVAPRHPRVAVRDTISDFPTGFNLCITNPPWLYRSSAARRGLQFPKTTHDDLYKHCLDLCLRNCNYVVALLPASFLQSNLFHGRLSCLSFLTKKLFRETDNPACLALFNPSKSADINLYENGLRIGSYNELNQHLPKDSKTTKATITFNDAKGELGFVGIDNTRSASIRFCWGSELNNVDIKPSSRSLTKISGVALSDKLLKDLNESIASLRDKTHDIFLTTFKGVRSDGRYRRRMDYGLARRIINQHV